MFTELEKNLNSSLLLGQVSFKYCLPSSLKPGSHMLLTYLEHSRRQILGHRYSLCEHLSRNHYLSQALTAGLPWKLSWIQLCRQASSCQWWKCFMWTSSADTEPTPVGWFNPQMEWLKIVPIWFSFRTNLSMLAINRKFATDPVEQIAKLCQFQLVTMLQVGEQDTRSRLYCSLLYKF